MSKLLKIVMKLKKSKEYRSNHQIEWAVFLFELHQTNCKCKPNNMKKKRIILCLLLSLFSSLYITPVHSLWDSLPGSNLGKTFLFRNLDIDLHAIYLTTFLIEFYIFFCFIFNVFHPLEAGREKLLLVKKADMDMSSTDNNIVILASDVKNPKNEEKTIIVKSTPTPRSFSDIFTGPKLVLVQKSMVQNKSEEPSMPSQNLNTSFMPSTPNPSTTSSTPSTTKSTTTDRVITTTYSTSTAR